MGKESLQQMVLGQLDRHIQKNEVGALLQTFTNINYKMNQISKCKSYNYITLRRKRKNTSSCS